MASPAPKTPKTTPVWSAETTGASPARPATTDGRKSMAGSLSLPDLNVVERRNAAYAETWRQHVGHAAKARHMTLELARRRQLEAAAVEACARRGRSRVLSAQRLLGTPLPAGMTPLEFESHATGRREALHAMHVDCIQREEQARRQQLAQREATLAADRAEMNRFLEAEAQRRVRDNKAQHVEAIRHKRELERQRLVTDRERDLAERAAERAAREEVSRQRAASLAETAAARRAQKDALTKEREEQSRREVKAREARARAKAQSQAAQRAHIQREQTSDYAKRLEKVRGTAAMRVCGSLGPPHAHVMSGVHVTACD